MKAFQVLRNTRLPRFQFADGADDDRIARRHIQHPLVVLQPRAGLHLDRADNAELLRQRPITRRQGRLITDLVVLRRPRHTLLPVRVEQVDMGIDNGDWGLSQDVSHNRARGQKGASIHPGILSQAKAEWAIEDRLVRMRGLEPPRLATPDPKSDASANFATAARGLASSLPYCHACGG